ncbi:ABC transporter permease [Paraburkholderia phosphatilytica]|uniref:ABC transporter permease n=1 Tax=Paraburkholderia phosphatilytica TaxID=2282883 RepID=UPI00197EC054|nr:ABC transporter permease [Paraburkholderia phosphatilytica]
MKFATNDVRLVDMNRPLNEAALRRLELADRSRVFGLSLPGLLLVGVLLLIPFSWLVAKSLLDDGGQWSLVNYRTLLGAVYLHSIATTLEVSSMVTLGAALIGYPVAYLLCQVPRRIAGILLVAVVLPYWTSTLVRTYAWLVLLQRNGIVNTFLVSHGIVSSPLHLVNNLVGVVIGMTHVMTPVLIMPLYGAMRSIDPALMKAAAGCGATPREAFRQVFFPQTLPGLSAGIVMVFVISLGYYVTPALLGGGNVNVMAMQIQTTLSTEGDWGLVSATGVVLVLIALAVSMSIHALVRFGRPHGGR